MVSVVRLDWPACQLGFKNFFDSLVYTCQGAAALKNYFSSIGVPIVKSAVSKELKLNGPFVIFAPIAAVIAIF